MASPNFSVVLIARNEAKTLPRLIASLKEFQARGGEIVLMDTGSSDGTAQIARDLGCVVHEEGDRFTHTITKQTAHDLNERFVVKGEKPIVKEGDRIFDFANARNHAAALASNDIVAMPDCDEIYTHLDLDKVCVAISDGVEQLEYNFVFAHDEHGGELVKFLHSKFYSRSKLKWVGIIHEVLRGDARRQFFPEEIIKLEHFQNQETNRGGYLKGLALSVVNEPENDRNAHYFGRELLYAGRPKSAIKQLEAHVAMKKWPEERSQSQIHIGEAHMALGDVPQAIHSWIDAYDTCSARREPLMKIADYYYNAKSPDHVIAYVSAVLQISQNSFYASFQPYYQHYPHELLYWAYWHKGIKELAKMHFDICLAYQPFNPHYLHDYRLFYDLPKVSFVIPTLRAAPALQRTLDSIHALDYPEALKEIIVIQDNPRLGVARRFQEGVAQSTGEWIVYAADDMEFMPDCLMAALQAHRTNGEKGFIAFNSGMLLPDEGNICEHFMIYRELALDPHYFPNGVFDTDFHHVGVDNLLWAIMKKAGEAVRCEHARFIHHHFSRGAPMDEVHKIGWDPEKVAQDRALLAKKLAEI